MADAYNTKCVYMGEVTVSASRATCWSVTSTESSSSRSAHEEAVLAVSGRDRRDRAAHPRRRHERPDAGRGPQAARLPHAADAKEITIP